MNQLKCLVYLTLRGYSSKPLRQFKAPKLHKQREQYKKVLNERELYPDLGEFEIESEDEDFEDDPDKLDPDMRAPDKTWAEHNKEMAIAKEKLKLRIVAQKYFKTQEPNFLTWSERAQIKALHDEDSVEWSVEQLSEAFPALPDTIKKILKSKHAPKSAEDVIRYDKNVVINWEKFKAGSLPLDPKLEAHLNKFKGRKINVVDLQADAEKFVKPKPVFPTPECKFFSSLVKGYIEEKKTENHETRQLNDRTIPKNNDCKDLSLIISTNNQEPDRKHATFDAFLTKRVNKIAGNANLSLEDKLLVDEYKERQNKTVQQTFNDTTTSTAIEPTIEKPSSPVVPKPSVITVPVQKLDLIKDSPATGIIEWKKKIAVEDENYPQYIKIPRKKVQSGVTFKVHDRYYDADGEFLYRVPGLQS